MMDEANGRSPEQHNNEIVFLLDKLFFYFIIGLVFQAVLFKTSQIWLSFLPFNSISYFTTNYLYSLYLCLNLPTIRSQSSTPSTIPSIYSDLSQKISFDYAYSLFSSNKPAKADKLFNSSFSAQALKYLFAIVLLYNIPQVLGILVCYTILCLDYGKNHADGLLNLPIIITSSLFGILIPIHGPLSNIVMMALSAVFCLQTFKPSLNSNETPPQTLSEQIAGSLQALKDRYETTNGIELFTLCTLSLALTSPYLAYLPLLSPISSLLLSPRLILAQSFIINIYLGYQLELFFSKCVAESPEKIPSPEKIVNHYAKQLYPYLSPLVSNAYSSVQKST